MLELLVLRHNNTDNINSISTWMGANNVRCRYLDAWKHSFVAPESLETVRGIVMLGGRVGECMISRTEYRFIETILKSKIPFIGVCLGAQILSEILGGKIYPNAQPEVGWISLDLEKDVNEEHPICALNRTHTKLLSWHEDTCDVPKGATLLASTPICANQAFQYENALGLQFHIELPEDPFKCWLKVREEELQKHILQPEFFMIETLKNLPSYHSAIRRFWSAWLKQLS